MTTVSREDLAAVDAQELEAACLQHATALFAQGSFLRGASRILDVGSCVNKGSYNYSPSPEAADAWAVYRDWMAVGDGLRIVIMNAKGEIVRP